MASTKPAKYRLKLGKKQGFDRSNLYSRRFSEVVASAFRAFVGTVGFVLTVRWVDPTNRLLGRWLVGKTYLVIAHLAIFVARRK